MQLNSEVDISAAYSTQNLKLKPQNYLFNPALLQSCEFTRLFKLTAKLGIIGGGVMGEALLSRLIVQKIYQPQEVIVSELQPSRQSFLQQQYGVEVTAENQQVLLDTPVVLLAIKPQVFDTIAQ